MPSPQTARMVGSLWNSPLSPTKGKGGCHTSEQTPTHLPLDSILCARRREATHKLMHTEVMSMATLHLQDMEGLRGGNQCCPEALSAQVQAGSCCSHWNWHWGSIEGG